MSNDEFDILFAEITATEQTDNTSQAAQETPATTEANLVDKKASEETLPDIKVEEEPKSTRMYKAIPDDQKVPVPGSPFDALIYPNGYCRCKWPATRITNQCILYLDQVIQLADWFQGEEYPKWLEQAKKSGLRVKGRPHTGG